MAGCIGILCTERRPEGINIPERLCKCLSVQLSAYRQIGFLIKEILCVIYSSVRILRQILQIQCGNAEHLSRSLTVTSGDQRCMHIHKSSFLEEFVDRIRGQGTNTEYSLECIRSRAQM